MKKKIFQSLSKQFTNSHIPACLITAATGR